MPTESLQPVRETGFYTLRYQQQPALLRGHLRRSLTAQEFTQVCEMTLAMAHAFRCRYWLIDGRTNSPAHRFSIHNWLEEEYLPRALDLLGRPPCLAYLVPKHWHELPDAGLILTTDELPLATYRMAAFEEEAAAMSWLEQFRDW